MPAFKREDPTDIIEDVRLILLHLQLHMLYERVIAASPSSSYVSDYEISGPL